MSTEPQKIVVGNGDFEYEPVPGWGQLPVGWIFYDVVGTATDSRDRVYVFNRGGHPIIIFEPDGTFVKTWGEGEFTRPHGISVGPDDVLYLSDDSDHTVRKYTPDGERLLTLGTSGQPSDTGVSNADYRTITQGKGPFNLPTNLALSSDGEMYVTDGYGNARVHKFTPDGTLLFSWGEPGDGPGQFNLPHGLGVDKEGHVYVADRENSRIQIFDKNGTFLNQWTDVVRPTQVFIDPHGTVFVSELGGHAGLYPWMTPSPEVSGGRVSVFDIEGNLQARWGGGNDPCTPGDFFSPHDISVDSKGDVYVGEVTMSAGGKDGMVPEDCPALQKFIRRT